MLSPYDSSTLTSSRAIAAYFEAVVAAFGGEAKLAANWVMGSVAAKLNEEDKDISASPVSAMQLAGLLKRIADNTISNKIAREVFDAMWAGEGDADAIIEKKGLKQVTDSGAIEAIIDEVLAANAAMVEEYKAGKEKAFNALVGQCMKASRGKANPSQVNELLKKKLS
jgi:aspartyl-tRNA(Asn)/glutamyl-tRNA(Gln) amidotransferase subunit B